MTTSKLDSFKHNDATVIVEFFGKKASVSINGVTVAFATLRYAEVVNKIKAGDFDQYIKDFCTFEK